MIALDGTAQGATEREPGSVDGVEFADPPPEVAAPSAEEATHVFDEPALVEPVGAVRAVQLDEGGRVETAYGVEEARAGDYVVEGPEGKRVVGRREFELGWRLAPKLGWAHVVLGLVTVMMGGAMANGGESVGLGVLVAAAGAGWVGVVYGRDPRPAAYYLRRFGERVWELGWGLGSRIATVMGRVGGWLGSLVSTSGGDGAEGQDGAVEGSA